MNAPNHQNPEPMQTDPAVDLIELAYRLLDKALLLLLAAILGAFVAGRLLGTEAVTTYASTARLYLISNDDGALSMSELQAANYLVGDYLAVLQTQELQTRVANRLGQNYTAAQLRTMVSVANIADTHMIAVTVRADTAAEAEHIANVYARVAGPYIADTLHVSRPKLLEKATPAVKNTTSPAKQNYTIGAMLGLCGSCIAVVVHGCFDDRVYTPEDLQNAAGLETWGILTKQKKHPAGRRRRT